MVYSANHRAGRLGEAGPLRPLNGWFLMNLRDFAGLPILTASQGANQLFLFPLCYGLLDVEYLFRVLVTLNKATNSKC